MSLDSLQPLAGRTPQERWAELFELSATSVVRAASLIEALTVQRDDVLTARLAGTRGFYEALSRDALPRIGSGLTYAQLLEVMCEMGTFTNLVRAGLGPLQKPAFEIRLRDGETRFRRRTAPALPLDRLASACGVEASALRAGLRPLIQDGALEILRSPKGVTAVALKPGVISEARFCRYYRA